MFRLKNVVVIKLQFVKEMFNKIQRVAIFFDNRQIKIALQHEKQFYNSVGSKITLPEQKIIEYTSKNFNNQNALAHFQKQLNQNAKAIDSEELWNLFLLEADKPQDLRQFLQSRYDLIAPFYLVIKQDFIYFQCRKDKFFCRSKDEVEDIKKSKIQQQEKKNFYSSLFQILSHENLASYKSPHFAKFLDDVEESFYRGRGAILKLLERVNPWMMPALWASFTLLQKVGRIAQDKNFFLASQQLLDGYSKQFDENCLTNYEGDVVFFDKPIVTIDDEETRDMDDALSIKKTATGYQLTIFITNVSSYVEQGSLLDEEAKKRASSIYMPDRFINMFPDKLVYEKLSLRQGATCPVIAYEINFSVTGEELASRIYCCQVRVSHRLSFNQVNDLLEDKPTNDLTKMCHDLFALAKIYAKTRQEKGAIEIGKPYLKIRRREKKTFLKKISQKSPAYFLVSEFMIIANYLTAKFCLDNDLPCLYRSQFLQQDNLQQTAKKIKKTFFTTKQQAHQGLGLNYYTQATSPIRRYLDLIMQRQIFHYLQTGHLSYSQDDLCYHYSQIKEKINQVYHAQNLSDEYYLLLWLQDNLGRNFQATVIAQSKKGFILELDDLFYNVTIKAPHLVIGDQYSIILSEVCPYYRKLKAQLI